MIDLESYAERYTSPDTMKLLGVQLSTVLSRLLQEGRYEDFARELVGACSEQEALFYLRHHAQALFYLRHHALHADAEESGVLAELVKLPGVPAAVLELVFRHEKSSPTSAAAAALGLLTDVQSKADLCLCRASEGCTDVVDLVQGDPELLSTMAMLLSPSSLYTWEDYSLLIDLMKTGLVEESMRDQVLYRLCDAQTGASCTEVAEFLAQETSPSERKILSLFKALGRERPELAHSGCLSLPRGELDMTSDEVAIEVLKGNHPEDVLLGSIPPDSISLDFDSLVRADRLLLAAGKRFKTPLAVSLERPVDVSERLHSFDSVRIDRVSGTGILGSALDWNKREGQPGLIQATATGQSGLTELLDEIVAMDRSHRKQVFVSNIKGHGLTVDPRRYAAVLSESATQFYELLHPMALFVAQQSNRQQAEQALSAARAAAAKAGVSSHWGTLHRVRLHGLWNNTHVVGAQVLLGSFAFATEEERMHLAFSISVEAASELPDRDLFRNECDNSSTTDAWHFCADSVLERSPQALARILESHFRTRQQWESFFTMVEDCKTSTVKELVEASLAM